MYQYFFYVNKYRSKEAKRKTGHPGVSKVNAGSVGSTMSHSGSTQSNIDLNRAYKELIQVQYRVYRKTMMVISHKRIYFS